LSPETGRTVHIFWRGRDKACSTLYKRQECRFAAGCGRLVLDSIDWARHRRKTAAAKLHTNYLLGNLLPSFAIVEDAGHHDSARALAATENLGDGDILVTDRAYRLVPH